MRKDYILDPAYSLYQREDMFCINTDTKCLAGFMKIRNDETVLDIGTNNAALLRIVDNYNVKKMIGVEVLKEACEVAQKNVDVFIKHDCEIINARIQDVQIDPVDVIISNPPYFSIEETNSNIKMNFRQMGRVEVNLNLIELLENASRLLKSNGRLYIVHRPGKIQDIINGCTQFNLRLKTLQFVLDHRDQEIKSLLIEAIKEGNCQCTILPPLEI